MKVLKFGGTSVGTVESLRHVKSIVESITEPTVVVVSALGGLTDNLIATAKLAAEGKAEYKKNMQAISDRHFHIIDELVIEERKHQVNKVITTLLSELSRLYDGVFLIADLPEKTLDLIVSYGERMSSIIVSGIIINATHHNSIDFIKTERWFSKNIADTSLTNNLIIEEFPKGFSSPAIMGGFIASDNVSGEITNLGRGGSDYSAALVAAALNADILEIWTDVDGFMTSDPRIIKDAIVIPAMTFIESMELCSFGAKVIYPPTIYPVFHKNIPIKILNTFNPTAPGTFISDTPSSSSSPVTGLSSIKNTSLFEISGPLTRNLPEINSRAFNALARKGISVYLVHQDDYKSAFSFALNRQDAEKALKLLQEEFAPELSNGNITEIKFSEGLATIAVVGENLHKIEGISTRILNALISGNMEVFASSNGTSKTTATFVVKEEDADKGLNIIHSIFF
ncbi:MAG: aspartate kinase [Muribaculaceae bacterium]|nr:aspartate kinase [Muribaculaceae bacterium]